MITSCITTAISSCVPWQIANNTKIATDIKWDGNNAVVSRSKLFTTGIYRSNDATEGKDWWWKFYDDGSCIMFYVDSIVKDKGKIDFEKTFLAGEDMEWDNTYNKPGIFRLCGDTIFVNVYSNPSTPCASSYNKYPWPLLWTFARVKMTIVDSHNLIISNDRQNNMETIHLRYVPCVNIVEVDRIKKLKDVRWMWTKRKYYKARNKK